MSLRESQNVSVVGAQLFEKVNNAKVLVVGAGGIGCELLKNLVLSGFRNIHVVDLDTIDVSNLNRQFLFRKQHVSQSKAKVAHEQVLRFNPAANITSYHDNIKSGQFGPDFVQEFDLVMNALDNIDARRHVNRVCLATNIPLIESGTAGFLGQVQVIRKGVTECFECHPKPTPKTFPVCTIRSNPSAPIHCIVWGKMLFGRLFGKKDDSNAVTSMEDRHSFSNPSDFADQVFDKVFVRDIIDLANLTDLWRSRLPPAPLSPDTLLQQTKSPNQTAVAIKDQVVWSPADNLVRFKQSIQKLCIRLGDDPENCMDFEKDDDDCLDFVTSASNLRSLIFNIPTQSRFDVKAMAGNIIPAIATTNAIVAGMIVIEAFKLLSEKFEDCRDTYLMKMPSRKRLYNSVKPSQPNPKCYVCCGSWQTLRINIKETSFSDFINHVVKEGLGISAPIVSVLNFIYEDGDERMDAILPKKLCEIPIVHNTVVRIEDFDSDIRLELTVLHSDVVKSESGYIIEGASSTKGNAAPSSRNEESKATAAVSDAGYGVNDDDDDDDSDLEEVTGDENGASQAEAKSNVFEIEDSDEDEGDATAESERKRIHETNTEENHQAKRSRASD